MTRGIRIGDLAQDSGYHRSHLLRIRRALTEPGRDTIAAIVSAVRRLSLEDVQPETLFELSSEESGPWRNQQSKQFARELANFRRERAHARSTLLALSRHPRSDWFDILKKTPRGLSAAVARMAALEGRRLMDSNPREADALLEISVAVADAAEDLTAEYRAFLGGRALVDRADVLRQLGSYRDGLALLDQAEQRFEGLPSCTLELGRAWFGRGSLLYKMNGLAEALHYLRLAVNIFAALDDHRRVALARFVEGNVLFEQGRIDEARSLWLSIAPVLEAGRDWHSLATLWLNLGWCELERGNAIGAREWLDRAFERFTKLRSTTDVARARWALALVEARHGDREVGLSELRRQRRDLENLGVLTEAGLVGLDIAEILLLDPSTIEEAAHTCRDLVGLFERAGAKKELLKAVAYLWEAANARRATPELIRHIRRDVSRAERDANYRFDTTAVH